MNAKLNMLLQELSRVNYRSAESIADKLGVSEKTVRIRVKELNDYLTNFGAAVLSGRGQGYKLEIIDEEKFHSLTEKRSEKLPTTSTERVPYILAFLLNRVDYIKIDDICEFLYVSRNTLIADLKRVEYVLNMYNLKLERRPNYGIIIQGSEFDKRVCMANSLVKWNDFVIGDSRKHAEMHIVGGIILNAINKYKLRLSEISFDNLVIHTYIAIRRIKRNCGISFDTRQADIVIGEDVLKASEEIANQIQSHFGIIYDSNERTYLAIHFCAKMSSGSGGKYEPNVVISGKIDELVQKMIFAVYESFKFDFRGNLELRMNLNQHMVPFDIRMQYGIPLKNPMLQQIKKEYALAYTIASGACTVLNEYYNKNIDENELGYFAILFALAIEKQDKILDKKNVVVVCVSGKSSSQLFLYKYRQAFGKYIDKIFESTVYELENFDFIGNQIDYVFSTVPIHTKVPVPVFEVNLFMESKDIITYSEIFEKGSSHFVHHYYRRELFFPELNCKTKDEVIKELCSHAARYYELPEDFYNAVMKREEMGQTDFGNLIAIPHPYKIITKDHFVAVGIMKEPIWWGHNEVQVVFLIALSTDTDKDIEKFYQLTTSFLFNPEKIAALIQNPDFDVLYHLLCSN